MTYSVPVGLRGLATAEVAEGPCSVAEHGKLAAVAEEVEKRLEGTAAQDVVTAVRAVTGNVAEGPDGLLANIGLRAGKELDEDGDGTGFDDDLSLGGRAGGNVGQGPSSFELDKSVRGSEEFDETADDTSLDNFFDRGIALLGEKLTELGRGLDLLLNLVGEDTLDHLGEVLAELHDTQDRLATIAIWQHGKA